MNVGLSQVCVYCASSNQIDIKYFEAAGRLGDLLAEHHITLVYGGGASGLMGRIADHVMYAGGKVIGIIPDFMKQVEWAHNKITELHIVGDMHERKKDFWMALMHWWPWLADVGPWKSFWRLLHSKGWVCLISLSSCLTQMGFMMI